eukprot:CAMPEP_0172475348 /NCGR_PEP_ID=MMETSP1065-20121228/69819_1 /TAXON_ID=265537 /ORGANISM="Amphiprora paludosa, Strain CCMP125" /LENGTH=673 /DNA_ID=CAMNT_0013233547 /DNA_START=69 /DNA_END=2090 /DNA_ORIENTATION=+
MGTTASKSIKDGDLAVAQGSGAAAANSKLAETAVYDVDAPSSQQHHHDAEMAKSQSAHPETEGSSDHGNGAFVTSSLSPQGGTSKGMDLVWSSVSMRLMDKKNKGQVKLHILQDMWGKAEAGKTTAIMGASGAGKTSLFQTLAGRVPSSGGKLLQVRSQIYLGGAPFDPSDREQRKVIAYVSQEDALHEQSTPREALLFSSRLRLPKTVTNEQCQQLVANTLKELGLEGAADTIIGGGLKKGISGGEKRRVSIGMELVAKPSLIFLDEPTSGLDSFAAAQVMKLLQRVAQSGNTVLFTVHQPSSNIFNSFDRLILLNNKGKVMHQGSVSEITHDFANYGYPVPSQYNPADWVIDVAQGHDMEELTKARFFSDEPATFVSEAQAKRDATTDKQLVEMIHGGTSVSKWKEFLMVQQREMAGLTRNPASLVITVVATAVLSVIFGVIFFDVGRQDRADFTVVSAQLGAVVNVLIATLMSQSNPAMLTFSKDRPVFLREFSTDHYTIFPYFLSKLWREAINTFLSSITQALVIYWLIGFQMGFGELVAVTFTLSMTATAVAVMLGACFDDISNALMLFTLLVVPQFYFSGLFISIELIPSWVAWAQYLCSLTYAARISFAYEFDDCDPGLASENCDTVLEANNVDKDDVWWYWLALLGLFVAFRLGGVAVLRYRATY